MSAVPRPPAFVNDLETCVGCHACAVACANENGLAPGTSWRQVVTFNRARRPGLPVFHLSIACNHCLDAPCLRGCPALAITRDPRTGAVLIDEGRCIGCRYCSWVCPYDAPRFDAGAGVMRKCTLCSHRLAEGLAPACVSLCPVGALRLDGRPVSRDSHDVRPDSANSVRDREVPATSSQIVGSGLEFQHRPHEIGPDSGSRTITRDEHRDLAQPSRARHVEIQDLTPSSVAGFPDADIRPMIRFLPMRARAGGADARSTFDAALTPPLEAPAPPPKISLRTEWSLAAFTSIAVALAGALLGWMIGGPRVPPAAFALAGLAAIGLSTAHLGRPLRAWRAALNWRHSWLSREVIGYSLLVGLGTAALALDVPGGSLAWAATVAAALALVSIDQVYVAMARRTRSPLDDHAATSAALLLAGVLSRQAVLWLPALLFRAAALALRIAASRRGARSGVPAPGMPGGAWVDVSLTATRALVGLAAPLALWLWAPASWWPWAVASTIAGEVLDRLAFYAHLDIVTPHSQVADDEKGR